MTQRSSDERKDRGDDDGISKGEMGIRSRHLSLGFTPLQNPLVYRIHDRRIRHDAHHMRAQPSIKRANAFFGKNEFEGLKKPGVFTDVVDHRLPEASAENLFK